MRTKLYMIALAAMTMMLALSACSESEDLLSAFHSDPNAVRITAQVGKASADGFTRSNPLGATEADQKKFNDGDMISVKADGQDAVTYKLVEKVNEWQPQDGKFLKWESETMNFTAYYPATFDGNITQPTEYTDEASLAKADFMSYSGPQTNKDGNNLTLTMERKMARVVVEIDGFNDQYAGATIDNVNSLSICGVKAYKHSDNKFYALIKPCAAQSSATFISLDVAEGASKTTTETLAGIPALEAGKSYTYQLTVGKDKVSVSGITVKDWTTGEITSGKAEYNPDFTFTADTKQTFKMITKGKYTISGLQYSVNNGEWKNVVENEEVTFGGTNGTLRLRGTNIYGTASNWSNYSTITFTDKNVKVTCTGDIRTLLDWEYYKTVDTQNARFCFLFYSCAALTSAPELPAKTLANYCYYHMFEGCTSLTSAPELKATTLEKSCYPSMFYGCTSLTSAPKLKATTLATNCYYRMFEGCTSLTSAPELKATTLAASCYSRMFYGCTKLSTVTMLAPSDQISKKSDCCNNWLNNAGTDKTVSSRTLKVMDADAYTALEGKGYLPDNWKKDATNTTVKKEDNTEIK